MIVRPLPTRQRDFVPREPVAPAPPEPPAPPDPTPVWRRRLEIGATALAGAAAGGWLGSLAQGFSPFAASATSFVLLASPTLSLAGAVGTGLERAGAPEIVSDLAYNLVCLGGIAVALAAAVSPTVVLGAGILSGARAGRAIARLNLEGRDESRLKKFRQELPRLRQQQREAYQADRQRYEREKADYDARLQVWKSHRPEASAAVAEGTEQVTVGSVTLRRKS